MKEDGMAEVRPMEDNGTLEQRLTQYLTEHDTLMNDLRTVRRLELPQCYIAAGYIRNYVWDRLHGFGNREKHDDIDVVYYDADDVSEERDVRLERRLIEETGNRKWSVKNQARMHIRNQEAPYRSTADALGRWPETVTAIGAALDDERRIRYCAPYGFADLFGMTVRQSPLFADKAYYLERVRKKRWKSLWPLLTIVE